MKVFDRLYGRMETENPAEELLSCEKIRRLDHISLSAVPDAFLVPVYFKDMASRLEHSIGVSHLVSVLCNCRPEFREFKDALLLSAISHDAGAPPFSHNGEHLLEELTDMRHEQFIGRLLKGSAAEDVIRKYGYTLKKIEEIISGNGAIGKLMNNAIDIDNMDNTERYGFSSGIIERISDPEKLAKAFMLKGGVPYLDRRYSAEIEKWKECRRKVYNEIVYGDTNISAGGMLIRALGFVYEEKGRRLLKDGFTAFTDNEALQYLERNCDNARVLVEKARIGVLYKKAAGTSSTNPSRDMEEICKDWKKRLELADSVSDMLKLARTDVCVQAFRHKPQRDADNFYPPKAEVVQKGKKPEITFDIRVFINPKLTVDEGKARKIIGELAGMQ